MIMGHGVMVGTGRSRLKRCRQLLMSRYWYPDMAVQVYRLSPAGKE